MRGSGRGAIAALREKILGPQRKPTRIRKPYKFRTDWEVGHAVAYRLKSGRLVIMRVVEIVEDLGNRTPVVELCNWIGKEVPDRKSIQKLPAHYGDSHRRYMRVPVPKKVELPLSTLFALYKMSDREDPGDRATVVATGLKVMNKRDQGCWAAYFGGWAYLDEFLERDFGLS